MCFVVLLCLMQLTEAQAASKGKQASSKVAHTKPNSAGAGKTSLARRQASLSKHAVKQARQNVQALNAQIVIARNGEQSVRRRYEGQSGSQARNAIRRATLERANLENQQADATQRLQSARARYQQAKAQLRMERRSHWQRQTSGAAARPTASKARKLSFAQQPLGRTGSGSSQPTRVARGVLKSSSR
jgi:hypothetical protein